MYNNNQIKLYIYIYNFFLLPLILDKILIIYYLKCFKEILFNLYIILNQYLSISYCL